MLFRPRLLLAMNRCYYCTRTPSELISYNENFDPYRSCLSDITVADSFLSVSEEKSMFNEVEKTLRRMRYQYDHWDDAIHGYRETERLNWLPENKQILDRVKKIVFNESGLDVVPKELIHVLDIESSGYIKPHVDAVRFCGGIIAGLSLLSDSIMRFSRTEDDSIFFDVLLKRRSLYIMRGKVRFDFRHEILASEKSYFKGSHVPRARRISIMLRCEPEHTDEHNRDL